MLTDSHVSRAVVRSETPARKRVMAARKRNWAASEAPRSAARSARLAWPTSHDMTPRPTPTTSPNNDGISTVKKLFDCQASGSPEKAKWVGTRLGSWS